MTWPGASSITINLNVPGVEGKLDAILAALNRLIDKENQVDLDLVALGKSVQETTDAEDSAVTVLGAINNKLADLNNQLAAAIAANDPAKTAAVQAQINAFQGQLATHQASLAAAIAANTTPPPAPAA